MDEIKLTKSEITQIFILWYSDAEESPDEFNDFDSENPEEVTDTFLDYVNEVKSQT